MIIDNFLQFSLIPLLDALGTPSMTQACPTNYQVSPMVPGPPRELCVLPVGSRPMSPHSHFLFFLAHTTWQHPKYTQDCFPWCKGEGKGVVQHCLHDQRAWPTLVEGQGQSVCHPHVYLGPPTSARICPDSAKKSQSIRCNRSPTLPVCQRRKDEVVDYLPHACGARGNHSLCSWSPQSYPIPAR